MTRVKPLNQTQSERRFKKLLWLLGLFCGTLLTLWVVEQFSQSSVYQAIEHSAFVVGEKYDRWFTQQSSTNPVILIGLAFAGGLVASISPCILSMLPVNLSYIGTRDITSRRDAFLKAGSFVLGVVTVLSLLGLFSSIAGFILIYFRGYFQLAVGLIIVVMGLSLAGIVRLPMPQFLSRSGFESGDLPAIQEPGVKKQFSIKTAAKSLLIGPYGVGLTFALVSSPCTSPVMVSVLTAGAATGSQVQSSLMMVSYALGYTAIIFLASLFTGLAKRTRGLLVHSEAIVRIASIALLLVGTFYLISGGHWVIATFR